MAGKSGIIWFWPTKEMEKAIRENYAAFSAALYRLGVNTAGIMVGHARDTAPWEDRTGNARSGLFTAVEGFGQRLVNYGGRGETMRVGKDELVIVLGHTMEYGVYLELSNQERFAVVIPTIRAKAPEFMAAINIMVK
jgi:hypothetical protein